MAKTPRFSPLRGLNENELRRYLGYSPIEDKAHAKRLTEARKISKRRK